jgi:hypothetical protein
LPVFVGGRRMAAGSGAIALAAVLTACGGSGDPPTVVPPLSTTPTATASTTPAADPKAAAVAVVKEYFRLLNSAERDMDAEGLAAIETSNCVCRKVVRSIRDARAHGQRYFGHAVLRDLTPVVDSLMQVEVLVVYDSSPGGLRRADGSRISSTPARTGVSENFYVRRVDASWVISDILAIRRGQQR